MHDKMYSKMYGKTETEEHIVLIRELNSYFIGHVSPAFGSTNDICCSIIDFLQLNKIKTDGIPAIGCDGTAVNTKNKEGVMRLLELKLEKPMQWVICLLHASELSLRHLL